MRISLLAGLLLLSPAAAASDFTGIATIFVGLPVVLLLNAAFGIMLGRDPSERTNSVATVLLMVGGLLVLLVSGDAIREIERGPEWVAGAIFFCLAALALFLYVKVISRPLEP